MAAGHGEKLSRKQDEALAALLAHSTIGKAAKAAGINEKTLREWLKLPEFAAEYRGARRQVVEQALATLQQLCEKAVGTLRTAMGGKHAPTRVRAALGVLDRALRAVELLDVEERLAALEARQKARGEQ